MVISKAAFFTASVTGATTIDVSRESAVIGGLASRVEAERLITQLATDFEGFEMFYFMMGDGHCFLINGIGYRELMAYFGQAGALSA